MYLPLGDDCCRLPQTQVAKLRRGYHCFARRRAAGRAVLQADSKVSGHAYLRSQRKDFQKHGFDADTLWTQPGATRLVNSSARWCS